MAADTKTYHSGVSDVCAEPETKEAGLDHDLLFDMPNSMTFSFHFLSASICWFTPHSMTCFVCSAEPEGLAR